MTEREMLEAIRKSAEQAEIPRELSPERTAERLKRQKRRQRISWARFAQAAAFLVLAVGAAALVRFWPVPGLEEGNRWTAEFLLVPGLEEENQWAQSQSPEEARQEESSGEADEENPAVHASAAKQDAGDMFVVAKSEEQVYAALEQNSSFAGDDAVEEDNGSYENGATKPGGGSHSQTNVQTAGVDESDIAKTDGDYIYAVCQNDVVIVDISGETMRQAAKLTMEDPDASVTELYVSGDVLNLVVQRWETVLRKPQEEGETVFWDTRSVTCLRTYDISNRDNPQLVGEVTQDGAYYTSRKIGDIVYLFTREYGGFDIPEINGSRIAYDNIYLSEQSGYVLTASSVDVKQPGQVLDHIMLIHGYGNIYVSTGALYLYQTSWNGFGSGTQLAKFSLEEGTINAVDAVSFRGQITDTFAICENDGQLRVLTTDWQEESVNQFYIFDENLKLLGSLKGLAPGESIYSARFLGNMAYFVTYRNVDPLFAVDLSDPSKPKVLSELKITGFSDYLHFWGADRLLGIGYETDPETGERLGLKLSMFDISDPSEVKVEDSLVLEEISFSAALDEYKTVLADSEENLFGFTGESYDPYRASRFFYYLYRWGEGGFERLLAEELSGNYACSQYRGLYSGDRFYLVGPEGTASYDMGDGYKKIEFLEF